MKRRALLAATGTALTSLCGCLESPPADTRATEPTATSQNRITQSPTATPTPTDTPMDDQPTISDSQGPARGQSDAKVTTEVVETDENVEYIAENDTVRYVAAWKHTNHEEVQEGAEPERKPVYETTPFDSWARTEAYTAAAKAAAEHANTKLGGNEVGGGITSTIEGKDLAPIVSVQTVLDREGEVVSEASVSFEELVAVTPASVDVIYRLSDQAVQLTAPIYARYTVLQQE